MSQAQHDQPVVIVTGADDKFAMPVAVTLYSALSNLAPNRTVKLFIIDDGITEQNKRKVAEVLDVRDESVHLKWLKPDVLVLSDLTTTEWHSRATYLRLLLPSLLPEEVDQAIYLDSDLVIEADLSELWDRDITDYLVLAVQDYAFPYASSRSELYPVYQALGLGPATPYLNAGVLVVNLKRWRAENIAFQALEFTRNFKKQARFLEQDGLNAIIAGRWGQLDPRWNINLYVLDTYGHGLNLSKEEMHKAQAELMRQPAILHYTGLHKPWHFLYIKPAPAPFFYYLKKSGWFSPVEYVQFSLPRRVVHALLQTFPRNFLRRIGRQRTKAKNWLGKGRT